jgi:transposase
MMAGFVIKLLEACPTTQAVCTLTRLSWSTVNAIMVSAVERGMLRRTEEEISYLGIDEKSSERGHTYASILTDIDRSRVLDLVPERKLGAAVGLLETLTPTQRAVGQGGGHGHVAGIHECCQTMHAAGRHRA